MVENAELARRAQRIRLVLTDCDGTLTDGGTYFSSRGEEMKRFSMRDGKGVELLRHAGIRTAIITQEDSPIVRARGLKLDCALVCTGVADKSAFFPTVLAQVDLRPDQVAFLGDDVNDLDLIHVVREQGLTGAPEDAMPAVLGAVHYRCAAAGGNGAFRDFADWILHLRSQP